MKRDKKNVWKLFCCLGLAAIFASTPMIVMADPPPWAPAHGHHKHKKVVYKYIYYPNSQVYFSPTRRVYYYQNNGAWTNAAVLPPSVQLGKGVSINLGGVVPYTYHPTVVTQYPVIVVP